LLLLVELASAVVPDAVLVPDVESEVEADVVSEVVPDVLFEVVPDVLLEVVPVLEADDPLESPSKFWSTP
jgi:hypothetical protein